MALTISPSHPLWAHGHKPDRLWKTQRPCPSVLAARGKSVLERNRDSAYVPRPL